MITFLNRKEVIEVLKDLKKVAVKPTNKLPILNEYVLVESNGGSTSFTYSDGALLVTKTIDSETEKEGSALYPLKQLDKVLRKVKAFEIELTCDGVSYLQAGAHSFKFKVPTPSQYPKLNVGLEDGFTITSQQLEDLFKPTLYAVSKQESRPILQAVHTEVTEDGLQATTTDSHRLVKRKLDLVTRKSYSVNIDGALLEKTLKMRVDPEVQFIQADNYTVLKGASFTAYILNKEGNYPATDRLIPTEFINTVEVQKKELLEAVELSKLTLENTVKPFTTLKGGTVKTLEGYEASLNVTEDGDTVEINFNPDYMIDALKNIDADTVKINLVSTLRPFLITGGKEDGVHLVTPIRTAVRS